MDYTYFDTFIVMKRQYREVIRQLKIYRPLVEENPNFNKKNLYDRHCYYAYKHLLKEKTYFEKLFAKITH